MKSQTIITVLIICFVVSGLFIFGSFTKGGTVASVQNASTPVSSSSETALFSAETNYDFGNISMKDGNVTKDFTVVNSSDRDIILRKIETSCMCTMASLILPDGSAVGPFGMAGMGAKTSANEIIKANESRIIRVVYDPNAHGPAGVGRIDRFVTLTDASSKIIRFGIKALVTP